MNRLRDHYSPNEQGRAGDMCQLPEAETRNWPMALTWWALGAWSLGFAALIVWAISTWTADGWGRSADTLHTPAPQEGAASHE